MKTTMIKCAAIFLILLSCNVTAQKPDFTWLRSGSTLNYYLLNLTKEYEFIVNDLVLGKSIKFSWTMGEPANMSGVITISEDAMKNSLSMVNYFRNGGLDLIDKTTVWVSTAVYKQMKKKKPVEVMIDSKKHLLTYVRNEEFKIVVDDKETSLPVLYCKSDGGAQFWILDYQKSPLILKMELDFLVELKTVKTTPAPK